VADFTPQPRLQGVTRAACPTDAVDVEHGDTALFVAMAALAIWKPCRSAVVPVMAGVGIDVFPLSP